MQFRRLFVIKQQRHSNQKRAKVGMSAEHVKSGGEPQRSPSQRNDVTSVQFEHPACFQGSAHFFMCWLYQCNDFVVHTQQHPSSAVKVKLCVDIVPSSGGYSQFSVTVSHTACKMAVCVMGIPGFDH